MKQRHDEVSKANLSLWMEILNEVFIDNKYTLLLISLLGFSGNISKINMFYKDLTLKMLLIWPLVHQHN